MDRELTKEEKSAISKLNSLAKVWPDSLWLFSGAGTLCVMIKGEEGPVMTTSGGVDDEYCIDTIDIENDGGDW